VLFLAATHDLVLDEDASELAAIYRGDSVADPWPPFRDLVDRRRDDLADRLQTRSVQTNEVGRSAAIALALAAMGPMDRAVTLVELGPSAGLNLFVDRWRIDYERDGAPLTSIGPPDAAVRLHCELRGPSVPARHTLPTIAGRTGVDPAPIDASDPEASRWLRACVWPGVPERPHRLAAALEVVGADPPTLVRGDAVTDLAPLVRASDPATVPVVVSTWALAYVRAEGRAAVFDALESVGAERDLALVTLEEPRCTSWLTPPGSSGSVRLEAGDGTPTMLGLRMWRDGVATSTPLAMSHPHGRWVHWLDPGTE